MRRTIGWAGLVAITLLTTGAAPASHPLGAPGKVDVLARTGRTGLLVNANEARLWALGGYGGERLRDADLRLVRQVDGMGFYVLRAHGSEHFYADRDGDHRMDAGLLYNPATGMVSADFDCDGRGDQMLADLTPDPPMSREELIKRLSEARRPS
jgi:hypothetical protein